MIIKAQKYIPYPYRGYWSRGEINFDGIKKYRRQIVTNHEKYSSKKSVDNIKK